jgi:hypothetical protein
VEHWQQQHSFSQRRACRLVLCNRKSVCAIAKAFVQSQKRLCNRKSARHVSTRGDNAALRKAMMQLADQKPAWGYRLLHGALRLDGFSTVGV